MVKILFLPPSSFSASPFCSFSDGYIMFFILSNQILFNNGSSKGEAFRLVRMYSSYYNYIIRVYYSSMLGMKIQTHHGIILELLEHYCLTMFSILNATTLECSVSTYLIYATIWYRFECLLYGKDYAH
jgi:hypothetical protein